MVKNINRMNGDFSIIIMPDTQELSRSHPEIFEQMAERIAEHAGSLNVQIVLHVGDVVDNGAADEAQYRRAKAALNRIDQANIPMIIAPGNHDYDNMVNVDRSSSMFNRYFGVESYAGKSWFGGVFEQGRSENCYAKLEIGGRKYIYLALEFGPRDEVLAWADRVLQIHADHEAIIITHCYMYMDGTRNKPGDKHNPKVYKGAVGANDGEDMWQKCFRKHPNLAAVYSGHQICDNISYRMDQGDRLNRVFQSFQNWQCTEQGGEGRVRIVVYRQQDRRVEHYVWNPLSGQYETGPGYRVDIPMRSNGNSQAEWKELVFPQVTGS